MMEYRVTRNHQMYLPASIRRHMVLPANHVRSIDLGDGMLVVPDGTEWGLIEHYFPDSSLEKNARSMQELPQGEMAGFGRRYKIGKLGAFTVMNEIIERWGMNHGGSVCTHNLKNAMLITPAQFGSYISGLVPTQVIEDGSWQYNVDGRLSPYLGAALRQWLDDAEAQEALPPDASDRLDYLGFENDQTILAQQVGSFVLSHVGET